MDEFCWERVGIPGSPHLMGRFKNQWEPVFHYSKKHRHLFHPGGVSYESDHAIIGGEFTQTVKTKQGQGGYLSDKDFGTGTAYPGNRIRVVNSGSSLGHAAAFPVALPVFFVKAYTDPGGIVFDPFMGSGTTLIAAAQEGRRGYGCEISPGYCDIIRRRWTAWAKKHDQDPGPGALE